MEEKQRALLERIENTALSCIISGDSKSKVCLNLADVLMVPLSVEIEKATSSKIFKAFGSQSRLYDVARRPGLFTVLSVKEDVKNLRELFGG